MVEFDDDDNIVWGTASQEDNMTWGNSGEDAQLFDDLLERRVLMFIRCDGFLAGLRKQLRKARVR